MDYQTRRQAIARQFGIAAETFVDSDTFEYSDKDGILYVLWYPPGCTRLGESEETIDHQELARLFVTQIRAGGCATIPRIVDSHGNHMWELKVFDLKRSVEIVAS